jgi:antitoxin ParD1/3/4
MPKVQCGRYSNASEGVRDALRLLEDREKQRALRLAELHRMTEEGRANALSAEDGQGALDRLKAKGRTMTRPAEA